MAETIPGGATKDAAGAWKDAEGRPLDEAQTAAAEALVKERATALEQQEAQRAALELANDPATRAALKALAPFQVQPAEPKGRKAAQETA